MRKIFQLFFALSLMLLLLPPAVQAQERTITGTIVSEDSKTPLAGVTVRVKGTRRITQTDANGKFSIKLNPGETLQFTYVGYQTSDVKPGSGDMIGVSLKTADNTLGEVVVTAMDIKRNAREVPYSVQKVSGKDIAETQRENFLNSLQGRVAGLTITPTTGQAGASSSIVLRGFNSLTGNNQPLFIVDGIILDNSTINETSNGGTALGLASDRPNRNNDYTNRIADLNPNDIETVTVLKGPEATALYGSQASAGAIVITTKKASTTGKMTFSYDNSFRMQKINRYNDLNNEYAPGSNGVTNNTSFSTTSFSYFGSKYPAGIQKYNNIDKFFRKGFSQTHNLSADIGFKNVGFKVTGSYFANNGVVPNNEYKKYNVRVTNSTKIGKWIEITPSFQYVYSTNDKPLRSAGGYLLGLYTWPTTRDISTFQDADGNKLNVFQADPTAEIDNPLYNTKRNHSYDKTTRMITTAGINLTPFKWLSIAGRFGYDTYESTGYTFYHPQSALTSRTQRGSLDNYWRNYYGYNHTITATAKKDFGKFSTRLMVGTMWQDYKTKMFAITGTGIVDSISGTDGRMFMTIDRKTGLRLAAPVLVTDNNFAQTVGLKTDSSITDKGTRIRLLRNNFGEFNRFVSRQLAYFGEVAVGYKNVIFLSYTHRFEQSSLFPKQNRNYDYPSYSISAILSDIFPKMKNNFLNYWKVRASRASTARAPEPYKNQSVFVNNFTSSNVGPIYSYGFDNNNPNLRPERQKTYEIGTEIRLFKSRLSFDITYYNTLCTDQIQNQFRASYATGFILNTQNAASSRNQGVEIVMDLNPVKKKDFTWNVRFNFNHTWSKITSLPQAIAFESYIADTWLYGNARGGMIRNMPATTITGFHYQRNNAGQILISPTSGLPVVEGTFTVIGDRMPDFTLGTLNSFRYKNWSLSFLWDLKMGGDVFDATEMYLTLAGKSQRTANRMNPRVISGVLQDGKENTATPTANTIAIIPYFQQNYYTTMPEEEFIEHKVNYLRLRDISLNYTLPEKMLKGMKFISSLGVFLTGNDLILMTNYRGADPSTSGNTASASGVGGMGFDYGNLPTPVSLNFGLKATFK
jgi:TonB-linked SusC/RagA family outer membrane protein